MYFKRAVYVLLYRFLFGMVFMQFVEAPFELQREQLLLLLLLLPFELQREHVFCAGHVRGIGVATVSAHKASFKAQSKYFKIIKAIKVFQHNQSICAQDLFKAIKVLKNNQIISSPHQCQGW